MNQMEMCHIRYEKVIVDVYYGVQSIQAHLRIFFNSAFETISWTLSWILLEMLSLSTHPNLLTQNAHTLQEALEGFMCVFEFCWW